MRRGRNDSGGEDGGDLGGQCSLGILGELVRLALRSMRVSWPMWPGGQALSDSWRAVAQAPIRALGRDIG